MVLGHIIKASSRFISPGSKINASKAIDIAHGLTRTTLKKPGGRKRGSMYKMPGETIREEGGGISRTSNGRTTYSPGKLSDSEISKLRIQASNLMNKNKRYKKQEKLNQIDRKINTLKAKIKKDKLTLVNRRINSLKTIIQKDKAKLVKYDQKRILKNKLPVKQRPIKTKTQSFKIDKTPLVTRYPGLEAKKKIAISKKERQDLNWSLKEHDQKRMKGLRRQPQSMVPDKLDREFKSPSMFEQRQKVRERPKNELNEFGFKNSLKEGKNKGATKDGRFRNPLTRQGEQSYDPVMAKKWTGVGLGLAGGGTIAWDQSKNKFPDPLKFG